MPKPKRPVCKYCGCDLAPIATAIGLGRQINLLKRLRANRPSYETARLAELEQQLRDIQLPDYEPRYGLSGKGHFHSGRCAQAFGEIAASAGLTRSRIVDYLKEEM